MDQIAITVLSTTTLLVSAQKHESIEEHAAENVSMEQS
jgi:hypothetical protein